VDAVTVLATMDYTGRRTDGSTCVVNANLEFAVSGALP
jgi:hypothetical protein